HREALRIIAWSSRSRDCGRRRRRRRSCRAHGRPRAARACAHARRPVLRLCREHHDLRSRRGAQHGGSSRDGARPADARGRRHLPPRRLLVSGAGRRLYLDARLLPAVVWRVRQKAGEISDLQRLATAPAGRARMTMERPNLSIDGLMAELMTLAQISEAEPPVVTRVVFGEADIRARAYVKGLCAEAGLSITQDAIGNTFARWEGSDAALAPVGTGSHIDAIPNAGSYDGTVGVLGGLEAIRALQRAGVRPRRSIELLLFTSEEPTRFGIGCLGSRLLSGSLSPSAGETLRDKEGTSLNEVRAQAGFAGELESVRLPGDYYSAFLE